MLQMSIQGPSPICTTGHGQTGGKEQGWAAPPPRSNVEQKLWGGAQEPAILFNTPQTILTPSQEEDHCFRLRRHSQQGRWEVLTVYSRS